jgi:hypothetical protein
MDVTEDKMLARAVCKQRQIDPAAHISDQATLVKLADKIRTCVMLPVVHRQAGVCSGVRSF